MEKRPFRLISSVQDVGGKPVGVAVSGLIPAHAASRRQMLMEKRPYRAGLRRTSVYALSEAKSWPIEAKNLGMMWTEVVEAEAELSRTKADICSAYYTTSLPLTMSRYQDYRFNRFRLSNHNVIFCAGNIV